MKAGLTITEKTVSCGGFDYRTYLLRGWLNGQRVRRQFKDRNEAVGEKNRLEVQAANAELGIRTLPTRLTSDQLRAAEAAFELTPDVLAAAQWFKAHYRPPVAQMPLELARTAFLADREPHVRLPTYRDYKHTLETFCDALPKRAVDSVSTEDVNAFLAAQGVGKKRWNNLRGDLNAFFEWSGLKPRKWTEENPVLGIRKFKIARTIPEILTAQRAAELMAFVETYSGGPRSKLPSGSLTPYFALCLFGGLRPSVPHGEVWKIAQQSNPGRLVDLSLGVVRITPEVSKVECVRQVKIRPNLAAWLQRYPLNRFPLVPVNAQALITDVRTRFSLTSDVLRHTWISAHVAKWKSLGEAALEGGNSERMIRKHYLNTMSEADADAFWAIVPQAAPAQQAA